MRSMIMWTAIAFSASGCAPAADTAISQNETAVTETAAPPALMQWSDLLGRELPDPTSSHTYGDDPAQVADLWLPDGPGPHPVVLMVHGGCWQKSIADRTLMNYAADDLRQRGMAVWNIEYRGVDEEGGGYPGTFTDISRAAQALLDQGPALGLDTDRIVAFGHSAGGHLAVWLATQGNLSPNSRIHTGHVIDFRAVINSGGLADLEASLPVTLENCLANIVDDLTGLPDEARSDVFTDTSPARLLPPSTTIISVNGAQDGIAPPVLGASFTDAVKAADGEADYVEVPDSGHVELVSPGTTAFDVQVALMERYLGIAD